MYFFCNFLPFALCFASKRSRMSVTRKRAYLLSSLRDVDGASLKLIMSLGFHTGDPTIKKEKQMARFNDIVRMVGVL